MNITVVGIGDRKKNFEFSSYLTFRSYGESGSSVIAKKHCERLREEILAHNQKITAISRRRNEAVNPYKKTLELDGNKSADVIKNLERDIEKMIQARSLISSLDSSRNVYNQLTYSIDANKQNLQEIRYKAGKATQAERCRLIQKFRDEWDEKNLTDEERALMKIGEKEAFKYTFVVVDLPVVND